jgi:hypothetical protein
MPYALCLVSEGKADGFPATLGGLTLDVPAQDGKRAGNLKGISDVLGRVVGGTVIRIFVRDARWSYPTSNPFFPEAFVKNAPPKARLQIPLEYRHDMEDLLTSALRDSPTSHLLIFGECNGSVTGRGTDAGKISDWGGPVELVGPWTLKDWWNYHDDGKVLDSVIYTVIGT